MLKIPRMRIKDISIRRSFKLMWKSTDTTVVQDAVPDLFDHLRLNSRNGIP